MMPSELCKFGTESDMYTYFIVPTFKDLELMVATVGESLTFVAQELPSIHDTKARPIFAQFSAAKKYSNNYDRSGSRLPSQETI